MHRFTTLRSLTAILLSLSLLFPSVTLALEGALGGTAVGSAYGGTSGSDASAGSSEGSAGDSGDSPSESGPGPGMGGADAEATSQAAADAQAAASYGMTGDVDVNATAEARMNGTIDNDQVAMGDGTVSSLSAGKDASDAISAAAAVGGGDFVNNSATQDAYQAGTISPGQVVGSLTGTVGYPAEVAKAEIDAAVTKSVVSSLGFNNTRFGSDDTTGLNLSNKTPAEINAALSDALNNQKAAINQTTMAATDIANVFNNMGINAVNNTKAAVSALGYVATEVLGVKGAYANTTAPTEIAISAKTMTVANTEVNQSKVAELDKFGRDLATQINAAYNDKTLSPVDLDAKVDSLEKAYNDKKSGLFGKDADNYRTVAVEGVNTGTTKDTNATGQADTTNKTASGDEAKADTTAKTPGLPSSTDTVDNKAGTDNTNDTTASPVKNTSYSYDTKTKTFTGVQDGKTQDAKSIPNSSTVDKIAREAASHSAVSINTKNNTVSVLNTGTGDKKSYDATTGNEILSGNNPSLPGKASEFTKTDLGKFKNVKTIQSTPSTDLATGKTDIGKAPTNIKDKAREAGFDLNDSKTITALAVAGEIDVQTRANIVSAYQRNPTFSTLSNSDIKETAGLLNAIAGEASRTNRSVAEQIAYPNYLSSVTVDEKAFDVLSNKQTREALSALTEKLTDGTIAKDRGLSVAAPATNANHFYASAAEATVDWADDLSDTVEVGRYNKTTIGYIKNEIDPSAESVSNTTARSASLLSGTPIENVSDYKISTMTPVENLLKSALTESVPETVKTDTNDLVVQKQGTTAAHRKRDITETLEKQLAYASKVTGLTFVVTSGGQASKDDIKKGLAALGDRTGSIRHDHGNAADGHLVDKNGHTLDMTNPEDQAKMKEFMQAAVKAGATGIGAGISYMGKNTIHIGGGTALAWGANGKSANAPSWVKEALADGLEEAKTFDKGELDNYTPTTTDGDNHNDGSDDEKNTNDGTDDTKDNEESTDGNDGNSDDNSSAETVHAKTKEVIKTGLHDLGIDVSDQAASQMADALISTTLSAVLPLPLAILLKVLSKHVKLGDLPAGTPTENAGDGEPQPCQPTLQNPCPENQGAMVGLAISNLTVIRSVEMLVEKIIGITEEAPTITAEDVAHFPEYAEVTIVVDAKSKEITLARYDLVDSVLANRSSFAGDELDGVLELFDETALLFGDDGSIVYSNGLYSPLAEDGAIIDTAADTIYTYVVEYVDENGNRVQLDNNDNSLPENILTGLSRGIFTDTSTFTVVDVETITYDLVDPDAEVASDEYYDYLITLRDGAVRTVLVPQYTSVSYMQEKFGGVGFFGDVIGLVSIATNLPKDPSDQGLISRLVDGIKNTVASFINPIDDKSGNTPLDTITDLPTYSTVLNVDDVQSIFIYPNASVSCPQIGSYANGYVYIAVLNDRADKNKVTTITSARCGEGDAPTLVSETANNLATDFGITGASYDTLADKTYFRTEAIAYNAGIETLSLTTENEEPVASPETPPEDTGEDTNFIPNVSNDVTLEVKAVNGDGKVLLDWSTASSITISSGVSLYFRWDGSDYQQCLPFLQDNGSYALTRKDRAMLKGDTESEGFNVPERTATYRVECGGQRNNEFGVDERGVEVVVE